MLGQGDSGIGAEVLGCCFALLGTVHWAEEGKGHQTTLTRLHRLLLFVLEAVRSLAEVGSLRQWLAEDVFLHTLAGAC